MKFLRLTLLMCIAFGVMPVQANWLARASASIKNLAVRSGLVSAKQAIELAPVTEKQLKTQVEKADLDVHTKKEISPKTSTDFMSWFLPQETVEPFSFSYFSFSSRKKSLTFISIDFGWIGKRKKNLKKDKPRFSFFPAEKQTSVEQLPENCVDAECKLEQPEKLEKAEDSEIKSLPVTSMPEKGFYARVKAMLRK